MLFCDSQDSWWKVESIFFVALWTKDREEVGPSAIMKMPLLALSVHAASWGIFGVDGGQSS